MQVITPLLGWVKPVILERNKGLSTRALEKYRVSGFYIKGVHWKKVNGVIMYDYEAINRLYEEANAA